MKTKRQVYIVAVANPKGGVGKTTTTINLGAALAEKGRKVLLVDFDPQGHLTAGCGLKAVYASKELELASFILNGAVDRIKTFIVPVENFWVLPAHVSLVRLEDELVVQRGGESRVKKVLGPVCADFEFCLIDSPPAINILTDSILLTAKKALVPIQAEDTSIRGIEALEGEISELKDILDADIEIVAILPNMVARNSVCERVLLHLLGKHSMETERFESRWANMVTGSQIRKRVDLAKAWHEGRSIFSYNPSCDAVESYRKLASFLEEKAAS